MYNSLRLSPANAVTLNELMSVYAGMNEFDEAVSAAKMFPAALDSSEQCMTTLGRVYLAKGDYAEAVAWFGVSALPTVVFAEKLSLVGAVPADRYRVMIDWLLAGSPGGVIPLDFGGAAGASAVDAPPGATATDARPSSTDRG